MKPLLSRPRFDLTEPAGWTLGLGLLACVGGFFFPEGRFFLLPVGFVYLVIGLAAWQEKGWAAVAGMVVFGLMTAGRLISLTNGFSLGKVGSLMIFGWLVWAYWNAHRKYRLQGGAADENEKSDDAPTASRPLISIVLLLKSPRYLEDIVLTKIVENAWGGDYSNDDEEARDGFVVGHDLLYLIKHPQGMFALHNIAAPYFDENDEVADSLPELRLRQALLHHQAWLAVDLLSPADENMPREEFYPLIIRLIYELEEDDVLAVFRPETGQINLWSDDVIEALLMPEGHNRFNRVEPYVPVIRIADDDPAMLAAVTEARTRWPEFVEAFHAGDADNTFAVKAPMTRGDETEFIWISVTGLERDYIHGTLGNDPVALDGIRLGSVVEVPIADLNDWCITAENGELTGLFTLKAIEAAETRLPKTKN